MAGFYPGMIDSHRTQFREVFAELLENADGAVLYHCTAGKDRTGVQTALILTALGVPRDVILADFELSNTYYRPKLTEADRANPLAQLPPDVIAVFMGVDRAYLQAFFKAAEERYGSAEAYLAELGVGPAERQALRARYTE
jgi:protein-tyrosine phosphatase